MNKSESNHRIPISHWLIFLLLGVAWVLMYQESMWRMVTTWYGREEYSHGFFIPILAGFFIYQNKNTLVKIPFDGSWLGIVITVFGLLLGFIGVQTTIYMVVQYAFILTFAGVIYTYAGLAGFRKMWVSALILVFMIPLPEFLYQNLSQKLQLISSSLGVAVIRYCDISVYLEGNVIDLGNYKLQVVDACSGLRYLFPLMCFGFICAYIFKGPFWQKLIIFLTTVPLTVLMNSFRIGVIGVLVNYWGIKHAEGFLHDFEGWIVFMTCVFILFIEMWIFTVFFQRKTSLSEVFALELPAPMSADIPRTERKLNKPFLAMIPLFLMSLAGTALLEDREEIVPERQAFISFPDKLDNWEGKRNSLEQVYVDALSGLSDYIISDYRNENDQYVNFYAAYYETQSSGSAIHSPRSCIPGGGWKIDSLQTITVNNLGAGNDSINVNRVLIKLGERRQLVYYWFPQRGRNLTSEYMVKWYLFYDSLTRQRTDGALVRVTTAIKPGEDESLADKRLQDFLSKAYPEMNEHLPD